jgi:DNA-binding winged helix-turn-helix (wHTH) protein/TolB-like protein/Tfp pilus assembly protein PilF
MSNKIKGLYKFGDYVLNTKEKNLWRENELVHLSPRVFDTLLMLVERSGEVISKEEMMETIWGDAFVEENNLSQKVSILRKTFGNEKSFIETVPKRGFRFTEPVEFSEKFDKTKKVKVEHTDFQPTDEPESQDKVPDQNNPQSNPNNSDPIPARSLFSSPKSRYLIFGVLGVFAIGVLGALFYSQFFAIDNAKEIKSIAVMPFRIISDEKKDIEYLSDGMTESLIVSLSRLPKISIKASSSVFRYKDANFDAKKLGKELNVQTVLLGRIIQNGEDITLNLEYVDTQTENVIWAKTYERKIDNLPKLQTDIAFDISKNIGVKLTSSDEENIAKSYTTDSQANDFYLKGRYFLNKRNIESIQKSVVFFEKAIEKDPKFALAYSGLADTFILFPAYGGFSPQEYYAKAKIVALKAVELDDELAEAHVSFGQILWYNDFDWKGTEREFRRAIELNPNYPEAHLRLGEFLTNKGSHEEAINELKTVLKLDPLSIIGNTLFGKSLLLARRYDEAITQLNKTVELDSDTPLAYYYLAECYFSKENYPEAIKNLSILHKKFGVPAEKIEMFEEAFNKGGWKSHQRAFLDYILEGRNSQSGTNSSVFNTFSVAVTYARLDEKEKALEFIEKGIDERDPGFLLLKVLPAFDNLRDEKRFKNLIKKIGL